MTEKMTSLNKRLLDVLLVTTSGMRCWNVGKYLGSMLYFDFGEKIKIKTRRGGFIDEGSTVLSIRDCFWEIYKNTEKVLDSDAVTDADKSYLTELFVNTTIVVFEYLEKSDSIQIKFSNDLLLLIDTSNKNQTEDALISVSVNQGSVYDIYPHGTVLQAD